MLRSITWTQFQEVTAYCELEPCGEDRQDLRFALLAAVIAGSLGAKAPNGKPYTAENFLEALTYQHEEPTVKPEQTVSQMTLHLNAWMDAHNQILIEKRSKRRPM